VPEHCAIGNSVDGSNAVQASATAGRDSREEALHPHPHAASIGPAEFGEFSRSCPTAAPLFVDEVSYQQRTNTMRSKITPCLWFDGQAEDAARFYTSIFKNSKIVTITRYGNVGQEIHGRKPGSVMTLEFELNGQTFTALNGGPHFKFNEAISFQIDCESQEEIDYFWEKLSQGGDPEAQQCGWLKDKFGLSWQVVPSFLAEVLNDADQATADRIMDVTLRMKKLDFAEMQRAAAG
jgi:predicted 3-demethylubiquinone-9 3-methyltransferase (glyoxalase superfamily)